MKKLKINKETVTNLTDEQMRKIRGGSIVHATCDCNDTESCSFFDKCCPPPEKKIQKEKIYIP